MTTGRINQVSILSERPTDDWASRNSPTPRSTPTLPSRARVIEMELDGFFGRVGCAASSPEPASAD